MAQGCLTRQEVAAMRVLYLISARTTGVGGHFFSLRSLVEAIASEVECRVVNVGRVSAKALANLPVPYEDVLWKRPWLFGAMRRLDRLVRGFRPDLIHAYDETSLFFARVLALRCGCALLHTKCGGPNPEGYYPRVRHIVLFSHENLAHFAKAARFRAARFHLIPNRVNEIEADPARIERLRAGVKPGMLVVLRVARIGAFHEHSSLQALALVRQLRAEGLAVCFIQVGVVNDAASLKRIQDNLGDEDRLFTEPAMTRAASELLEGGDLVVGTGRGFMEAASRRRVLLAPLADAPHPVLVTPENFGSLFEANFSARSRLPAFDAQANYEAIRRVVTSAGRRQEFAEFARKMFETHFSLAQVLPRYLALYRSLPRGTPLDLMDLGWHALRTMRRG